MHRYLFIFLFLCTTNNLKAEIYKWVDEQGNTHFGDIRPDNAAVEKLQLKINTYTSVSHESSTLEHKQQVVMYSTAWCGYCKKARQYFKKNNIAYTDYDIEKDTAAKKRYKKMLASGVPVILVGKIRMNGFSEKGFEKIYQ